MPIPQVTDRLKEAPAVVLRAVFAGIGQLLLAAEKFRNQAMGQLAGAGQRGAPAQAPPPAQPPAPPTSAEVTAPHEPAGPPPSAESAAREGAGPPTGRPAAPAPAPAEAAAGEPPIPGYDDLSIASLRARLRVLDAAGLRALLDYERAHAHRETVISMFERRLAKITGQAG